MHIRLYFIKSKHIIFLMSEIYGTILDRPQRGVFILGERNYEHIKKEFNGISLQKINTEQTLQELMLKYTKLKASYEKLERELKECQQRQARYQKLFHGAPAGYLVFNTEGQISDANQRFCNMVSIPFRIRYKYNIKELIKEEDRDDLTFMIRRLSEKNQTYSIEAKLQCGGDFVPVIVSGSRYGQPCEQTEKEEEMLFAGIVTEVSELKKEQQAMRDKSIRDPLTGLYNRTFYNEYIMSCGNHETLPVSAAILDLDRLKMINDSLGHSFGDQAITTVAKVLQKYAREHYIFARIGGDEIAAFFPKTELSEAESFLKKVESQVGMYNLSGIRLSFSWGCAVKNRREEELLTVLSAAEDMMYRKKFRNNTVKKSETLDVILNALFNRNPKLHEHSLRMSWLLGQFASYLDMEPKQIEFLQGLGYVHDIGMASISDEILNKRDHLTYNERQEVNRHPETGFRILKSVPDMEEEAQIVLYHHENWDGSGYPYGLSGDSIPVESRMLLILDTYDRMKYAPFGRQFHSDPEIIRELKRWSGLQFDPFLTKQFIQWLESRKKQF